MRKRQGQQQGKHHSFTFIDQQGDGGTKRSDDKTLTIGPSPFRVPHTHTRLSLSPLEIDFHFFPFSLARSLSLSLSLSLSPFRRLEIRPEISPFR
ncbi:hypothetical protein L6452_44569 [Arctium lappa]|uniref:Uncharacterized protein n=1 Tax=Arctium lappa TaxID=4217 RepID=A0ACB8XHW0_ARCLA|nr:hypothetical protein L6452_44569 [Arctium lappa]